MSSYKTRARDKGNINNDYTKAVVSGTSSINAESLTALNLLPNLPTKTNGSSVLTSSLLEIADINGLGSAIDGFVSYNGTSPAPIGNFAKISDVDGNIENSTITETDILNLQNDKVNKSGDTITGNLDMTGNALFNLRTITGNGVDSVQILNGGQGLDAFVDRARIQSVNNIELSAGANAISCESALTMNNNDIQDVSNLLVENIKSYDNVADIVVGNTLNLGGLSDILNIGSMTLTGTKYISRVADLGTPVGDFYVLEDNKSYIILGQITLQYGIEFGINCSLRGIDFSATITFDEVSRNCSIKAVNNNFYLSTLTIIGGGGRFFPTINPGLIDASNYNIATPPGNVAPFYGRTKRFKISDVNIIRPFKVGTIEGFGTLNFTNNFVNGGGGLAGQASDYYTNEGLSVSDGLSLEFNNNKMVLFAGAQQASTTKLLNLKDNIDSLLGFNAVTITGNIIHPRDEEIGINFEGLSTTELGNISGNTFIRTGGTAPLIGYPNVANFDNYNPLCVLDYDINSNSGVVNSEPILKSATGVNAFVDLNATEFFRTITMPLEQVSPLNQSKRVGLELELTGVTGLGYSIGNYLVQTTLGTKASIVYIRALAGGIQKITIADMDGAFLGLNAVGGGIFKEQSPDLVDTGITSTGVATPTTTDEIDLVYTYFDKDPRSLVLQASLGFELDEDKRSIDFRPDMYDGTTWMNSDECIQTVSVNKKDISQTITLTCAEKWIRGTSMRFQFRRQELADIGDLIFTKSVITMK